MTTRRTGIASGYDAGVADLPYQDPQPHQAAIVARAARFLAEVPAP